MFSGYLGSEEDEAKYKDSFDGEGFFKTGDLVRIPAHKCFSINKIKSKFQGYYDEEGNLFYQDRLKDVIKVVTGGHYHYVGAVEVEEIIGEEKLKVKFLTVS